MESTQTLHSNDGEPVLLQNLVMQYLAHEGYIEAAKAFTNEVQTSSRLLNGAHSLPRVAEYKEDADAVNRQSWCHDYRREDVADINQK